MLQTDPPLRGQPPQTEPIRLTLQTWASTLPVLAKSTEKGPSCSPGAGEGPCLEPESPGAVQALIFLRLGHLDKFLSCAKT